MKNIILIQIILAFVNCSNLYNETNNDNQLENDNIKYAHKNFLQEIFATKINLNHKYHNHSQSILSYLSNLTNNENLLNQPTYEEESNFLQELINEDKEYMNSEYFIQRKNYEKVKENLIDKLKNQVTVFKGEWKAKIGSKIPFITSNKGKIEFIFIFDKIYENETHFYFSFNINMKIFGDQLTDINNDKFILSMKSSSQITSLNDVTYLEDNIFLFPLERYYYKETHLLQFGEIINLLTDIRIKSYEFNNTIISIDGNVDTDDFNIEFSAKYISNIHFPYEKFNLLILINSIFQLLINIYLTICISRYSSYCKSVSYKFIYRFLYI